MPDLCAGRHADLNIKSIQEQLPFGLIIVEPYIICSMFNGVIISLICVFFVLSENQLMLYSLLGGQWS